MTTGSSATASHFAPTRWTLVLRANVDSIEGKAALSELCAAYYHPVFAFLRRKGFSEDTARDHAHAFFAHLLGRGFPHADAQRGRFRSYLLAAVKYFVADLTNRAHRGKRGGAVIHESLDASSDHSRALAVADSSTPSATESFDQEWAVTLINHALNALAETQEPARFTAMRPWLMGDAPASQAEIAASLGMSEGAFKVAVHRLRKQFRQLLSREIAHTVNDDADIEDELRYLCSVLSR